MGTCSAFALVVTRWSVYLATRWWRRPLWHKLITSLTDHRIQFQTGYMQDRHVCTSLLSLFFTFVYRNQKSIFFGMFVCRWSIPEQRWSMEETATLCFVHFTKLRFGQKYPRTEYLWGGPTPTRGDQEPERWHKTTVNPWSATATLEQCPLSLQVGLRALFWTPFLLFTSIPMVILKYKTNFYSYPDDTQLYLTSTHAPNHSPLTKAQKLKTELENIYVNIQGHPQPHPSVSSWWRVHVASASRVLRFSLSTWLSPPYSW